MNDTLTHTDLTHITLPCEIIWGWDNAKPCGQQATYHVKFLFCDELRSKVACQRCVNGMQAHEPDRILDITELRFK